MTTLAQVKRTIKPLLDRNPDLALVGRWIIVKPVRHIVRGILIDRTSQADQFSPQWAVMHLFEPRHTIFLSWGSMRMPPHLFYPEEGLWKWSLSQVENTLLTLLEQEALPKLRSIQTIQNLIQMLIELNRSRFSPDAPPLPPFHRDTLTKIIFDVALGDLESGTSLCAKPILAWNSNDGTWDESGKARLCRAQQLCRLLAADDRAGMAALLHEWEAQTVRNLKIEHLWERTPFPLELIA